MILTKLQPLFASEIYKNACDALFDDILKIQWRQEIDENGLIESYNKTSDKQWFLKFCSITEIAIIRMSKSGAKIDMSNPNLMPDEKIDLFKLKLSRGSEIVNFKMMDGDGKETEYSFNLEFRIAEDSIPALVKDNWKELRKEKGLITAYNLIDEKSQEAIIPSLSVHDIAILRIHE